MQTEVTGSGHCIWRHAAQLLCRQHLLIALQAERLSAASKHSPLHFTAIAGYFDQCVIVKAAAMCISYAYFGSAPTKPKVSN